MGDVVEKGKISSLNIVLVAIGLVADIIGISLFVFSIPWGTPNSINRTLHPLAVILAGFVIVYALFIPQFLIRQRRYKRYLEKEADGSYKQFKRQQTWPDDNLHIRVNTFAFPLWFLWAVAFFWSVVSVEDLSNADASLGIIFIAIFPPLIFAFLGGLLTTQLIWWVFDELYEEEP